MVQVTVWGRCFFHRKAFALPSLGVSANSRTCPVVTLMIFLLPPQYTIMTTERCYHIKKHFKMNDHIKSPFQKQVRATQMIRAASTAVTPRHLCPEHTPGGPLLDQSPQPQGSRAVLCEGGRTDRQILAPPCPPRLRSWEGTHATRPLTAHAAPILYYSPEQIVGHDTNVQAAEYFSLESHSQRSLGSP